ERGGGSSPKAVAPLTITAEMPLDADGAPVDETASLTSDPGTEVIGLDKQTITVKPDGTGKVKIDCGLDKKDTCRVSGDLDNGVCDPSHGICNPSSLTCTGRRHGPCANPRAADGAAARKSKVKVLGRVHGRVRGGKHGKIT